MVNHKRKRVLDLIPKQTLQSVKRLAEAIVFAIGVTMLASGVATIVVAVLQPVGHSTPYRFCLATASSDSCVMRPGIIIGNKVSKSPDKLLDYFGSIPERVQQQWRVWVMNLDESKTIELSVAEFYAWIDSVWKPLQIDERRR